MGLFLNFPSCFIGLSFGFCASTILLSNNTGELYKWTLPDGHAKIRLIIFFAGKDGETVYSQQKRRLGGDCG